jgi:carboxymethylenebutenolidase
MSANDEYVSPSAQASIQQELKDNPLVTIYRYEGVSHGFSARVVPPIAKQPQN